MPADVLELLANWEAAPIVRFCPLCRDLVVGASPGEPCIPCRLQIDDEIDKENACRTCQGTGQVTRWGNYADEMMAQAPCPDCNTGWDCGEGWGRN